MENKNIAPARTEVSYGAACRSPYLAEPLFVPGETAVSITRPDQPVEDVPLSFVVFRAPDAEADDWEDDPMIGRISLCALGEGDEVVEPVEVVNLGVRPTDFVSAEEEGDKVAFSFDWRHGEVAIDSARQDGDAFVVSREAAMADGGVAVRLTPDDGEPFVVHVRLPRVGFVLRRADGAEVRDAVEVTSATLPTYTYAFIGTEADDRFSIVLEDGQHNYLCVLQPEEGRLAVRDQRERLQFVGSLPAEGRLDQLMMGSRTVMVKNKNDRWRITLVDAAPPAELPACDPVALVRLAFERFSAEEDADGEALATQLLALEEPAGFQWWWLAPSDWSHEHLDGLLDLTGVEQDQERLMRLALLYNRYDAFMRRLVGRSFDRQAPIQGDQLQARNNKRKIARQVRRTLAHRSGAVPLWTLDEEARREVLHFSTTFHREFLSQLQESEEGARLG